MASRFRSPNQGRWSALDAAAFPSIADYAFCSDCEVNALIAPSGAVEWLCLPRPDSPSVFAAMLDRRAGAFSFAPADLRVPAGRRYLPGTLTLETTWRTRGGWLVVYDALCLRTWNHDDRRDPHYRRGPGDHRAAHVLLRVARCLSGQVDLALECEPSFDYGRTDARWSYPAEDYCHAIARGGAGDPELVLNSSLRVGFDGRRAHGRTTLHAGESAFVGLGWDGGAPPGSAAEAEALLEVTAGFWRDWLGEGTFPDHPWSAHLERSALTLKGLTYAPTGAMLAAATTSLPEDPGGERNWDYRYSWLRDSTFMLWGLYRLGFHHEADDFFYFVTECVGDGELQIMYGIGGERELDEVSLDHLSGYRGSRPVRIGNAAYQQVQHDVWGALLDSFYVHIRSRDQFTERFWDLIQRQVETMLTRWREPDRGIWEVRGEPRHFTSSKVMCWVAADRGARLARLRGELALAERWQAAATEIHEEVLANALDQRGVFTQAYGSSELDASVLLIPLVRFLPGTDRRVRRTVRAIQRELTRHGLVLRYRPDRTPDGLAGDEGTFLTCSFWLVSALCEIGDGRAAGELCRKLLNFSSPLGLYAEELDVSDAGHLGNFPQALTHLSLINAVLHVIAWEEQEAERARREAFATGPTPPTRTA